MNIFPVFHPPNYVTLSNFLLLPFFVLVFYAAILAILFMPIGKFLC